MRLMEFSRLPAQPKPQGAMLLQVFLSCGFDLSRPALQMIFGDLVLVACNLRHISRS